MVEGLLSVCSGDWSHGDAVDDDGTGGALFLEMEE
jgi:hypothetical protein